MPVPVQTLVWITATYHFLVSLQQAQHVPWERRGTLLWRYQPEFIHFSVSPDGDVTGANGDVIQLIVDVPGRRHRVNMLAPE